MRFRVRHVGAGEANVADEVQDAATADELRARLESGGRLVLSLQTASGRNAAASGRRAGSPKFQIAWWCRELQTLLKAGMTVVEAIETLTSQGEVEAQNRLLSHLRQGRSLSEAMRLAGGFPTVLVAGVTASEGTSTLVEALEDYLRYHDSLDRLRRQAMSAAIYPTLVVSLGSVICLFLLLYVVPRFSQMYRDLQGEPSGLTVAVLWFSRQLRESTGLIAAGSFAVLAAFVYLWHRGVIARFATHMAERIGFLRVRLDDFRLAKLYQSLGLLVRGGYTFDDALGVCEQLDLGFRMSDGLVRARREIARGRPPSQALSDGGFTDDVTVRLLAVGERTGAFETVLRTISDRHAQTFSLFVERLTKIVEPVLLMAVAVLVGSIVVMMYVPVFDIASGLKR